MTRPSLLGLAIVASSLACSLRSPPPQLPSGPERQFFVGLEACAPDFGWGPVATREHAVCVATHRYPGEVSSVARGPETWTVRVVEARPDCTGDQAFSDSVSHTIVVEVNGGKTYEVSSMVMTYACDEEG